MVPSFASHCLRITLTTGGRPFLVNDIHRTPCAGVAAACGNNNAGVTGIAYRCRILPIKVWGSPNLPPLSDVRGCHPLHGRAGGRAQQLLDMQHQ